MLKPKRTKYLKMQKGILTGQECRNNKLRYGNYGITILENKRISASEIEALRVAVNRKIKRIGKLWLRVFPDTPVSRKPSEIRMGKGKGTTALWATRLRQNVTILELLCFKHEIARAALLYGMSKLSARTKILYRE